MGVANAPEESTADFYVNEHRLRFVPPDIMRVWWNGPCTRNDFERIFEYGEQCMGNRKHFVLADFSRLQTIDQQTRKEAIEDQRVKRVAGLAVIGTTFHMRVLLGFIARAVEFFHPEDHGHTRFFATDAEALQWIAQERKRLGL